MKNTELRRGVEPSVDNVEIAKKSTHGSLVLFAGSVLSTLILAISAIVIARLLGPDGYGSYALALLFPNVLLNVVGLGVSTGMIRFSANSIAKGEKEVARRMTFNALAFQFIFGAVLAFAAYFGIGYLVATVLHRPELESLARFSVIAILSQTLLQSVTSALLGWSSMKNISIVTMLQASIKLVLATILVIVGFGVFGAVVGLVASQLIAGVFGVLLLYGIAHGDRRDDVKSFLSDNEKMLRFGFPHYVGDIISSFSAQFVIIVLATIATNAVVGYYQSSTNVLAAITVTSAAISQSLFPAFAHLEGTQADISVAFKLAIRYNAFVLAPVILFLIGVATPMIHLLYGSSYGPASTYLVLLALTNLPILLGHYLLPNIFNGVGKSRLSMQFNVLNGALLLVLALLLVVGLNFGVFGLISALFISNFVSAVFGLSLVRRELKATMDFRSTATILLASLVSLGVVVSIQALGLPSLISLVLDAIVFALVYLTMVPLLGALNSADLELIGKVTEDLGFFSRVAELLLAYERRVIHLRLPGESTGA